MNKEFTSYIMDAVYTVEDTWRMDFPKSAKEAQGLIARNLKRKSKPIPIGLEYLYNRHDSKNRIRL
ncbi:hypothetical protein STRDD11_01192 [Streptococcus sp. DD11]|uniref:hypothetical protein n=1 Tax=Streptococcus sp. DD11 TaxID=1777879 RepID=UPI00079A1CDB|nr:hypothetical protein [Streptococcus sp. DD11]KXT83987.1 hypothetical protein STRDD11_01192 [Streptococcus sp. DD11]